MEYKDFLKLKEEKEKEKFNIFVDEVRKNFINDEKATSSIYTRDKDKFNLKVCSLKNGGYALVKDKNEIVYKNESMHLCKVEFIMRIY